MSYPRTVADLDRQSALPAALVDTDKILDRAVLTEHHWGPCDRLMVELPLTGR